MPRSEDIRIIGIDFDNTLISYDEVFFNRALGLNLITPGSERYKKSVRDHIRLLEDGETTWQKMQAYVYGQGIAEACLNDGADRFLKTCAAQGIQVYVVSHKTEYAPYDEGRTNLRQAALDWMKSKGFFSKLGLKESRVFFEATRVAKIARLQSLGCTHFIDDLEEVFLEQSFPKGVEKILFSPETGTTWNKIHAYFFR